MSLTLWQQLTQPLDHRLTASGVNNYKFMNNYAHSPWSGALYPTLP